MARGNRRVPGTVSTTKEYAELPFSIRCAEAKCLRMVSDEVGMPVVGAGIDCYQSTFRIGKDAEKNTGMYCVHDL
jgi:hypothetical protein